MAKKQKSYFLTLDERRKLRDEGVRRPGRYLLKTKKIKKIVKEPTVVLTTRIAKSSYQRFTFGMGCQRGSKIPLSPYVEEALLFYLAYIYRFESEITLVCSLHAQDKYNKLLAKFRRKRKTGSISANSKSYEFEDIKSGNKLLVRVSLPYPRNTDKRIQDLVEILKVADISVSGKGLTVFPI